MAPSKTRPSSISSFTSRVTAPRRVPMRRARSAREIGWCVRIRLSAICRLISRAVPRVATRKRSERRVSSSVLSRCADNIAPVERPVKRGPPPRIADMSIFSGSSWRSVVLSLTSRVMAYIVPAKRHNPSRRRSDEPDADEHGAPTRAAEPAADRRRAPRRLAAAGDAPSGAGRRPGTILGNVKDSSGAAVPGARRSPPPTWARSSRAPRRPTPTGQYALRLLPVGNYKVEVTLTGFKNFSQTGIVLEVGPQRAHRRRPSSPAASRRSSPSSPTRRSSRPTPPSLSRTVGPERGPEPPAGQPRPLLAAQPHRRRDQQRRPRTRWAAPSSSRRSTAPAAPRSAASTSSSTAATTRPACAAPATRRRTRRRSRSSASSRTATPRSTAATRPASWTW